jgi:hypothetical protein
VRAQWTPAVARTVTPVGKPDAGDQHVLHQEVPIRSHLIVIGSTWSAEDLAREATLGLAPIRRAEGAENETSMTLANDLAVRRALESAGVEFLDENGGGPGVRLRKRHQKKS